MTKEHDYSGALEAFDRVLDDYNHGIAGNRTVQDNERDIELVRAALTAAKGDGWLPIESAPKDVKILVYQSRNNIVETAFNVDEHGNWKTGTAPMDYIVGVTHWMPLPKPPQDGGDDE